MSNQGLWINDPDTDEPRFIYYHDLEDEQLQQFIKPIGGFVFPAGLFMKKRLPEVPFYLKDWLPKMGKAMIFAPAKSGKSTLCLQLSHCIGTGLPFLGIPTTQGRVLYLQFELGESVLQDRMLRSGQDYENVFVGSNFGMKIDTPAGLKEFDTAMEAVQPDVLILDPKYKMILGDENEAKDMRPICDMLDARIEQYQCSILLIDHTGKDESKRGRGSSVWEDWVDSYIHMRVVSKKTENLRIELNPVFLRHAQLPPEPVKAELGDDGEFHLGEKPLGLKEQVSDIIFGSAEPIAPAQLFGMKLGANTSVYRALKELADEGKIKKEGRGQYVWKR